MKIIITEHVGRGWIASNEKGIKIVEMPTMAELTKALERMSHEAATSGFWQFPFREAEIEMLEDEINNLMIRTQEEYYDYN
ncbi:MAG: hypothetical protein Q4E09_06105 [Eubacteriales bacterium]|nr:hypothetical protein [Eubacteriales bacterium]